MTLKEALEEIKSRTKAYQQVNMPQGTFTNTIKAIEYGFAKQKTIDEFMLKFGYDVKRGEVWSKVA